MDEIVDIAEKPERRSIQSAESGVRVLVALSGAPGALPLKTIARVAGMSPSLAHRYLASYLRTGLFRQDTVTNRYDFGPMALRIGLAALTRLEPVDVATHALQRLGERIDRTCLLTVLGDRGPTIIRWYRGSEPLTTSLGLGSVLPLSSSATGMSFIGWLPERQTRRLVIEEGRLLGLTEKKAIARATGLATQVRRRGYGEVRGDVIPGLRAISAPILDHQGEAAAALTILQRMTRRAEPEAQLVAALLAETRAASADLGAPA
jgi:DNA-binding IclR family transcriptional regulator